MRFGCGPIPLSTSSALPSSVLRTVTKMNFTSVLMARKVLHPCFASSALLFGHHGAQKCTTVTCGPFTAAATASSTFSQPLFACANALTAETASSPKVKSFLMEPV